MSREQLIDKLRYCPFSDFYGWTWEQCRFLKRNQALNALNELIYHKLVVYSSDQISERASDQVQSQDGDAEASQNSAIDQRIHQVIEEEEKKEIGAEEFEEVKVEPNLLIVQNDATQKNKKVADNNNLD